MDKTANLLLCDALRKLKRRTRASRRTVWEPWVYWLRTLLHWCDNNAVFIVDVLRMYANSLPQQTSKKQNQSVHTAFLKIFRVVHEQMDKKCLRNTNILNDFPRFDNFQIFDRMACLKINLVSRWLTRRTKKIQIRVCLKMIRIQNFIYILWKFLQMSKLLCNVLKLGGANDPPPGWAPVVL